MSLTRNTPIAFFVGTLLVFIYLMIASPSGVPDTVRGTMLGVLFAYGLPLDVIATIFMRCLLIFLGGFSLVWLVLSLRPASVSTHGSLQADSQTS